VSHACTQSTDLVDEVGKAAILSGLGRRGRDAVKDLLHRGNDARDGAHIIRLADPHLACIMCSAALREGLQPDRPSTHTHTHTHMHTCTRDRQ
jgi:hypothetical protein